MFNRLKMKFAAKRMQRQKDFSAEKNFIRENATLLGQIILWPFRMIGRVIRWTWDTICAICSWIWAVLCEINLVGLINLALLVAIIVLCSMLILDILNCRRKPVMVSGPAQNVPVEYTKTKKTIPVPSRRNTKNGESPVINVVKTTPSTDPTLQANQDGELFGDVIIESRGEAIMIKNGAHIRGNLYLQRMRKYVLPCNVTIDGSLYLRDLHLLQFCGAFTVKGNIYVSPRSSFGPIPRDSKVGGQVIL